MANVPILRGLVTRWVLNFKPPGQPKEQDSRISQHYKSYNSTEFSREFAGVTRKERFIQRFLLCEKDRHIPKIRSTGDSQNAQVIAMPPPTACARQHVTHPRLHQQPVDKTKDSDEFITSFYCERAHMADLEKGASHYDFLPVSAETDETAWTSRSELTKQDRI